MKETIEKLFDSTSTPQSLTPDNTKILDPLIPSLFALQPDKDISKDVAAFCINILNSKDHKGLFHSLTLVPAIIKPILQESSPKVASDIVRIIDALNEVLENHDLARSFKQKPKEPENPILFFHLQASRYDAYPTLALTCHQMLREAEKVLKYIVGRGELSPPQAAKKLQGVITPFIHLVHFYQVDDQTKFIEELDPGKVEAAIECGQFDESVRYLNDTTRESYIRIIFSVMDDSFPSIRSRNRIEYEWGTQRIFGKRFIEEKVYEEGMSYREWIRIDKNAVPESEEGGYALEEGKVEQDESSGNAVTRRMLLSQIRPGQFPCFYERQSLTLNDYSRIFHSLVLHKEISDMNNDELAIARYFLTFIFYGFNPKKIANMKLYSLSYTGNIEVLTPGDLFYDADGEVVFYRIEDDQIANTFKPSSSDGAATYRFSKTIVELPTHPIFRKVMKTFLSRASRNISIAPLQALRDIMRCHRSQKSNMNPYSFPRSFFTYAVNRYGMDPLVASYISCRAPREQRAQTFYTSVSEERIHADAIHFQERLLKDILANCEKLGLPVRDDILPNTANTTYGCTSFVGSGFVPEMDGLKRVNADIRNLLLSDTVKDPKRHLNLYTFYTMLLLRHTTGLRQIEVERMKNKDLDLEGVLLSVHGKGNRLYDEYRIIPIPSISINVIEELKKAQREYYWWLVGQGKFAPIEIEERPAFQSLFYLVNEKGLPIPASSANIREFLNSENEELYPYKLNASRHLVRTYLFEKRVPYQLLNAFIGHQTKGKEFLSHYSLAHISEMRKEVMPHLDELARELDISLIPYKGKR